MSLYMFPASECTPFSLTELENIIRHLDNVIYDDVLAEWMEAPWAWKAHGDYRTAELSALIETIEHLSDLLAVCITYDASFSTERYGVALLVEGTDGNEGEPHLRRVEGLDEA